MGSTITLTKLATTTNVVTVIRPNKITVCCGFRDNR